MARDLAATVAIGELKELIVSVLLVLGQAGGPDVVIGGLLLDGIDTLRWGRSVSVPLLDIAVN